MDDPVPTREDPIEGGVPARHAKVHGPAWLLLAVGPLAVIACLQGGPWLRWAQHRWTGAVQAFGSTYYVQPEDRVITPTLIGTGVWEPNPSAELLATLRPGDTFIDIGADFGWYTIMASKAVGPTGRVIAFEPVPRNLEFLRKNVAANRCDNVTVVPCALSNRAGKLRFHLNRENLGDHSLLAAADRPEEIEVEATTLDAYLKDAGGRIALIKIDTEGAEGWILEGMRQTLARHPETTLFLEFTPSALRQSGFDPEAILRDFHGKGYEIRYFTTEAGGLFARRPAMRTEGLAEADFPRMVATLGQGSNYSNLLIRKRSGLDQAARVGPTAAAFSE